MAPLSNDRLAIAGGAAAVTSSHPPAWPIISPSAQEHVAQLLATGALYGYHSGGIIQQLEQFVADYLGVSFALAHGSGTAALHAAYVGLGIGPGDEVIVPAYTYMATVTPLFLCGATPILCDSVIETGNIDPAKLAELLSSRTKAIAVTHMWGHPADMDAIMMFAKQHSLKVIEDCSHAHGANYRGRKVGTIGDAGIFSLGAQKMVTGGMGGMLVTNSSEIYDRALILGHCKGRAGETLVGERYQSFADVGGGANYRITPVSAAICLDQFATLDSRIAEKTEVLNGLSKRLEGIRGLRLPFLAGDSDRGAWYGYKAHFVPEEMPGLSFQRYVNAANAEGMRLKLPGSPPLHLLQTFQSEEKGLTNLSGPTRSYKPGDFPVAEAFYASAISFPTPRLHYRCDALLDQYAAGLKKLAQQYDRLLLEG